MFEKASRLKLRFDYKGLCSVEDLWDLPVSALDQIFKKLNMQFKSEKEESLLGVKSKQAEMIEIGISIIRHIVEVKIKEASEKEKAAENSEKKKRLIDILDKKQNASIEGKSEDEIKKMIDELS
jgi:hypothetical protein